MTTPQWGAEAADQPGATRPGWVSPAVREEFPELALVASEVGVSNPGRRSPKPVREHLRQMSNRFRGAQAIALRREPIAAAYRIFFRHIGLDPDATRTPVEAAVLERMLRGAFLSSNLLDDALLIALIETRVPVWALDATAVRGDLGIRLADDDESLGGAPDAPRLAGGRLVVADGSQPLAVLFGSLAPGHGVSDGTGRIALFAVQVAGVPSIHIEEALWTASNILQEA